MLSHLEKILPKTDIFDVGWEPEYYGAADIIAKLAGRNSTRPYAPKTWKHGWDYTDVKHISQIIAWGDRNDIHLVHHAGQYRFAKQNGFQFVKTVGAPFIYVPHSGNKRIEHSLLVMPPHGLKTAKIRNDEDPYLDSISNISKEFKHVIFCIHPHDTHNGNWIENLEKRKMNWISGATVEDKNALRRMRAMFDSFEYVTSNILGSHIAYAAYCGCNVSLYGPFASKKMDDYKDHPWYHHKRELLEYRIMCASEGFAKEKYGDLFMMPSHAVGKREWAKKVLGENNKKSVATMSRVFGWTKYGRFVDSIFKKQYAYDFRTISA